MDTVGVKIWLVIKGIRQVDISNELNVSKTLVWMTIHNKTNNRRVIDWLIDKGCPEDIINGRSADDGKNKTQPEQ